MFFIVLYICPRLIENKNQNINPEKFIDKEKELMEKRNIPN